MRFTRLFAHEFRLIYRRRSHILYVLAFFLMLVTVYPLAMAPEPEQLQAVGAGVMWVALLLVVTLATDAAFDDEYELGILTQYHLLPLHFGKLLAAKWLAQFLAYVVPLTLSMPLMMLFYHYGWAEMQAMAPSFLLGGMLLLLLGLLANALLLGVKHGRLIGVSILLPLEIPILIFGAGTLTLPANELMSHYMLFVGLLFVLLPTTLLLANMSLKAALAEE